MEKYTHSTIDQNDNEHSLYRELNRLKNNLNLLLVISLDFEDFIELIFFCKFDLVKYYTMRLDDELDREAKA